MAQVYTEQVSAVVSEELMRALELAAAIRGVNKSDVLRGWLELGWRADRRVWWKVIRPEVVKGVRRPQISVVVDEGTRITLEDRVQELLVGWSARRGVACGERPVLSDVIRRWLELGQQAEARRSARGAE